MTFDQMNRIVVYGGVSCFPASNEDGAAELVAYLVDERCSHTVEYDPIAGWRIRVPRPEDRRENRQ